VSFQFLAFAAIEVTERIAAHAPLHDLTHVLPVGAVTQLTVGVLVATVIRLVLRAADAAAGILGPASPTPPRSVPVLLSLRAGVPAFTDRLLLAARGPPR
jgi:hypothetical protein